MVKIITATEATCLDDALIQSYNTMFELGFDEYDLAYITEARIILRKLKEKSIEEVLGEPT